MLKRVSVVALACAASLVLAGAPAQPGGKAKPSKPKYTFGLIAKSQGNPVFQAARTGAMDAAKDLSAKYGVEITVDWRTPVSEDAQKQAAAIEQLAAGGADGVAVSCSDAKTLIGAIDSAVDKGVPVVCFDSDAPESKRLAYFGTDDKECGKQIAQELARAMGEKGTVAILAGNQTAPNLQRRVAAVREEMENHPNIKVLDAYYHRETPQDAVNKLEEVQRTNPQITGWAMVGGWPLFTQHALDNVAGRAKVVAVDALRAQIPYVKTGQVEVLLAQSVYDWGYKSVTILAENAIEHKAPEQKVIKDPLTRVTKANADEYARNWDKWLGERKEDGRAESKDQGKGKAKDK
jgi:ribose transport system substrate-binding protein